MSAALGQLAFMIMASNLRRGRNRREILGRRKISSSGAFTWECKLVIESSVAVTCDYIFFLDPLLLLPSQSLHDPILLESRVRVPLLLGSLWPL